MQDDTEHPDNDSEPATDSKAAADAPTDATPDSKTGTGWDHVPDISPATDEPSADGIDYPRLVQNALRGVVRDALTQVSETGLPGDHHFVIDFATEADGVSIPPQLREAHPETVRIVLQHQFWNLDVWEDAFAVDLRFGGRTSRIQVPWHAIVSFIDPAAEVGLQFNAEMDDDASGAGESEGAGSEDVGLERVESDDVESNVSAESDADSDDDAPREGQVVSIDAFRKRR